MPLPDGQLFWYLPGDIISIRLDADPVRLAETLTSLTNDQLRSLWEQRKQIPVADPCRLIRAIWDEHKLHYPGLTNKPIHLSLPRSLLTKATAIKQVVRRLMTQGTGWPEYVVEWHMRNFRTTYSKEKAISDILPNVSCPWRPTGCSCAEVRKRLRESSSGWKPPQTEGHIFFIGREYLGPHMAALNVSACNMPKTTEWDARMALERGLKEIPGNVGELERKRLAKTICPYVKDRGHGSHQWPTTRDVPRPTSWSSILRGRRTVCWRATRRSSSQLPTTVATSGGCFWIQCEQGRCEREADVRFAPAAACTMARSSDEFRGFCRMSVVACGAQLLEIEVLSLGSSFLNSR